MNQKIEIEMKVIPNEKVTDENTIHVSDALGKKLELSNLQKFVLSCNGYSEEVKIVFIKESDMTMYCSSLLLNKLMLPTYDFSISITKIEDHTLSLGPVIALVTEIKEEEQGLSLGSIQDFCEELATYCKHNGVLFYVSSLNKFNENLGYVYNRKEWTKTTVPFPHIVHNRIHSRRKEQSTNFKQFIYQLQERNVPYFNNHFLNKWEVHEILQVEDHLTPYLPETILLENKQSLEHMIEIHQYIYLKPIHGSQGRKIYKIQKKDAATYQLDYTTNTTELEQVYDSFYSLFHSLRPRLYGRGYIVQQGIPLLTYHERPLDFRFLCQKRESDQWTVTSMIARVSAKEDIVSNLSRGGELKKINEVLKEKFEHREIKQIKMMMIELALEVATIISLSNDGLYGELGIDLALDEEGKPWIIEVNTKPSKNQDPKDLSSKIRPSAKALIHHCIYLANYPD